MIRKSFCGHVAIILQFMFCLKTSYLCISKKYTSDQIRMSEEATYTLSQNAIFFVQKLNFYLKSAFFQSSCLKSNFLKNYDLLEKIDVFVTVCKALIGCILDYFAVQLE